MATVASGCAFVGVIFDAFVAMVRRASSTNREYSPAFAAH